MERPEDIARALEQRAKDTLPSVYFDPIHYDVLTQMTAPDDVPFYRALVEEHGGPVLELGCGTGRVCLELARGGTEVVGVDLSPAMLETARTRATSEGLGVTLALGDIRSFELDQTFGLVIIAFNTFNHMLEDAAVSDCLAAVRRHMNASSRLVIDTFQPSLKFLGDEPEKRRKLLRYLDPYLKKEIVLSEENHYEPATQLNRIVWSYAVDGVEDARIDELTMRLFFPRELDAWIERSGLVIEEKYGDYDRHPFDSKSPKQLMICRLPDAPEPGEKG